MAFLGYLLKVGSTQIPIKYISAKSYKSTPNRQIDKDSYRDGDGILRRSILPHTATTIEFVTPYLHLADKIALQAIIPSRTKQTIEYWNDETNAYTTGDFYIPDIEYPIYRIDGNDILYSPITYQFIQY